MNNTKHLMRSLLLALFAAVCVNTSISALNGQVTFRVIAAMNGSLQQPIGIVEGSPGTFYSTGGSPNPVAFSITRQGAKAILGTFASNDNIMAPLVSASN